MDRLLCLNVFLVCVVLVSGHGRFWEPPGRGTEWRRGFDVPVEKRDYNDNEAFCGGRDVQWSSNGGKCGVCGDNWADPEPREHEDGGLYDNNIIVRSYTAGQVVELQPEITANHLGYVEFRLCVRDTQETPLTHDCLNQHVLQNVKGETRFNIGSEKGFMKFKIQLPAGVTCKACVIQWKYAAGNDWGVCPNGTGMIGCSDTPEQFFACADVEIL